MNPFSYFFKKKPTKEVETLDEEVKSLKRVQEIIALTDAVHTSLEKVIRKRLPRNEEGDEYTEEEAINELIRQRRR